MEMDFNAWGILIASGLVSVLAFLILQVFIAVPNRIKNAIKDSDTSEETKAYTDTQVGHLREITETNMNTLNHSLGQLSEQVEDLRKSDEVVNGKIDNLCTEFKTTTNMLTLVLAANNNSGFQDDVLLNRFKDTNPNLDEELADQIGQAAKNKKI